MAVPCRKCGHKFNDPEAINCSLCGAVLPLVDPAGPEKVDIPVPDIRTPGKAPAKTGHDKPDISRDIHKNGTCIQLQGKIFQLDRTDERPPANIYKTLAKTLITILLGIPFSFLFFVLGGLAIVFGILGFTSLALLFNPFNIARSFFELWEVFVLRRLRGTDTLPIFRGTIEDKDGNLISFQFIGSFKTGQLVVGHHVILNGKWKGDTLQVIDGRDTTTHSEITSSYGNPWRIVFFVILGLCAAVLIMLFLVSEYWVVTYT